MKLETEKTQNFKSFHYVKYLNITLIYLNIKICFFNLAFTLFKYKKKKKKQKERKNIYSIISKVF